MTPVQSVQYMIAVLFAVLLPSLGMAQEAKQERFGPAHIVSIGGFSLPKLLEDGKSGYYDQMMFKMSHHLDSEFEWWPGPITRTRRQFLGGRFDCLFPVGDSAVRTYEMDPEQVVMSDAFNFSRIHVFSPEGREVFTNLEDMYHHYIVFRLGYDLPEELEKANMPVTRVASLENGTRMLEIGRVDGLMAYVPDFFLLTAEMEIDNWDYYPTLYFNNAPEKILCHRSKETVAFINEFNDNLAHMKEDGELAAVLGPAMVSNAPLLPPAGQ